MRHATLSSQLIQPWGQESVSDISYHVVYIYIQYLLTPKNGCSITTYIAGNLACTLSPCPFRSDVSA